MSEQIGRAVEDMRGRAREIASSTAQQARGTAATAGEVREVTARLSQLSRMQGEQVEHLTRLSGLLAGAGMSEGKVARRWSRRESPGNPLSLSAEDRARVEAVEALARRGVSGLEALLADLDTPSWAVRRAVIGALARMGTPAVAPLCEVLRHRRDSEARLAAAVEVLVASTGEVDELRHRARRGRQPGRRLRRGAGAGPPPQPPRGAAAGDADGAPG